MTIEAVLDGEIVWSDTFIPSGASDELLIKASKFEALNHGKLTLDQVNTAIWTIYSTSI